MLLRTKNSSFCEKLSKFCINRANKNKAQMWFWRLASNYVWGCSRGNVWLIWLKFSDNVGMILVFIWYSHQKILRPPSSPQTAHLKCLKTYWLPCMSRRLKINDRESSWDKTVCCVCCCRLMWETRGVQVPMKIPAELDGPRGDVGNRSPPQSFPKVS